MTKNRIYKQLFLTLLTAATLAAGCGDDAERDSKLNVQVIGWGADRDGNLGFQSGLPTFPEASQVRVNLTHPGSQQLIASKSFNPGDRGATLPKLRYGNDLRLEFELLGSGGLPIAAGATPLFSFGEDEVAQSFRIQVDPVDEFAPVGAEFHRDGRVELVPTRMDYRAARSLGEEPWLGRVGHVTVRAERGNKALIVGGAHFNPAEPARRPGALPEIDAAHDDLMEFDPRSGYFTDLSYDEGTKDVREGSADRLFEARAYHTVTPIGDDKFVVIGGFTADGGGARALNSIELIDLNAAPGTRVQKIEDADGFTATLQTPRGFHTATYRSADNTIIIAGGVGRGGEDDVLDSIEVLELDSGVIHRAGTLSEARAEHEAVLMEDNETIWILGGRGESAALASTETVSGTLDAIEVSSKWDMKSARYGFSALRISPNGGQLVMALGGYTDLEGSVTDTYEISDLGREEFLTAGTWRLDESRGNLVAIELPNTNDIVVMGGRDGSQQRVTSAEVLEFGSLSDARPYKPRAAGSSYNDRADFSATVLSNGKILLVGGIGRVGGQPVTLDTAEYFTPLDVRQPTESMTGTE